MSLVPPAEQMRDPFARALAQVAHMADDGKPPSQCAVVYRSLAREYPQHSQWLTHWAYRWDQLGETWR